MRKSDLPFGSEFSPSQIDLREVLEFAKQHGGDWKAFEAAVRSKYFDAHIETSAYNRAKLANNTKLGMQAYGIIDDQATLTTFGQELYSLRHDEKALYEALARHILRNLNGASLIQCIQDIQASGEPVTLIKLREWLEERGIHFPRGGKHPSIMRLWLEKAGVFSDGYRVDESRLRKMLGVATEDIDVLARLSLPQRFFLRTLINLGPDRSYPSNEIEKAATATYGQKYNEKALAKQVLYPLEKAGYITLKKSTRAKPPVVSATPKLVAEVVEPLLRQLEMRLPDDLRPLLRRPFSEIVTELSATDRHTRGLALEALAFKLMRLVDLEYRATRLRGIATGGAEVDVIFESSRLVFSRWQVQCKNTARVTVDDVAKEVGLTHFLKSNVVVVVSTGEIGQEARRYANKIMQDSNLCVVMVDGADIRQVVGNSLRILDVLNREAKHAMKLKVLELQK
ncbi:MAG TPA: restriction endonuclease [Terriglobales bacterium]|nr:restriction endonuclease [Terriglobales bacterium]